MRLTRSNDDPRVMRDLEFLAEQYGPGDAPALPPRETDAAEDAAVVGAGDAAGAGAGVAVAAAPATPFDDPFVDRFVRVSVHVRRFLPYYLGAAMWIFVMLLIQPRADTKDEFDAFNAFPAETTGLAPAAQSAESAFPDEVDSAPFADIGATPSASGAFTFEPAPAVADTFTSGGFDAGSSEFSTAPIDEGAEDSPLVADSDPLTIVKSGYSSATAGTPLEQEPPGNGLPVAAAAGQVAKRSFVGLAGDETILKLKLVDDPSNLGAEQAVVRACPIVVEEWQGARGQAMEAEPLWNEPCVDGKRGDDGIWTFDLSTFGKPGDMPGFALTPGSDAAGASFNLTFDPKAVTSPS